MTHDFKALYAMFSKCDAGSIESFDAAHSYLFEPHHMDSLREALRLMAEVQEGRVKIVPVEPTDDMCFAGTGFHSDCEKSGPWYDAGMQSARDVYKAMVAAAPSVVVYKTETANDPDSYVLQERDVNDLTDAIPTKHLVAMLKDPPDNVKWTGDFGLFQRAAWRIEELDGLFSPRFIVPRARYNGRVHEAVNEAISAFIQHPHTIRYRNNWLRPEEYNLSIGACGVLIQAYLDFFTSVQDGEEDPAPENTIPAQDVIGKEGTE